MLDSTYLFLTCVKNNAVWLVKNEFLADEDWYYNNCLKIHPGAIYLCLMFGHKKLLELLLNYLPAFDFRQHLATLGYAINVGITKGHFRSIITFLEFLEK